MFVNTLYRNEYEVTVNSAQARAARAILKLGVREVAQLAKVTANTVSRIEQDEVGPRGPQPVTVEAIRRVYEERGIVFFDEGPAPDGGSGVRLGNKAV
ncbi:helix-turn-helix domain-containing protein [Sinorhizobium numidicum]|uniref:Helix-turn-helix domain-containing protein n=1 Tax=Sinorhizobium numidicum TaxID=680248 RepID=A0ABY8CTM9_9HYPH|nr:helix-turn-helix domain-containing protein [Sinorhizobium numidicum]WEX74828.1 helix-turn-helix domain-containing protein [Sinorhizobium numidicum]WEX80822.1 helix-turn-helix domain-containing protein [Sinorhizobium numidicum]